MYVNPNRRLKKHWNSKLEIFDVFLINIIKVHDEKSNLQWL